MLFGGIIAEMTDDPLSFLKDEPRRDPIRLPDFSRPKTPFQKRVSILTAYFGGAAFGFLGGVLCSFLLVVAFFNDGNRYVPSLLFYPPIICGPFAAVAGMYWCRRDSRLLPSIAGSTTTGTVVLGLYIFNYVPLWVLIAYSLAFVAFWLCFAAVRFLRVSPEA